MIKMEILEHKIKDIYIDILYDNFIYKFNYLFN